MSRANETTARRNLSIPIRVLAPVEELYYDAARGKPSYGGLSNLVTSLLEEFLKREGIVTLEDATKYRNRLRTQAAAASRRDANPVGPPADLTDL